MKKIIFFVFLFLVSTLSFSEAKELKELEYPSEAIFYRKASKELKEIPKKLQPEIKDIITNPNKSTLESVKNLIKENQNAIDLFKKATKQKNNGYIFGRKPIDALYIESDIPTYIDETTLLKYLLLQGKIYESTGSIINAEENYLAASRFLIHLSKQEYGGILAKLIEVISFDIAYPFFEQSINNDSFSKYYYKQLLQNLKTIKTNQDFLKSALKEEQKIGFSAVRLIGKEIKEKGSFEPLFYMLKGSGTPQHEYKNNDPEKINRFVENLYDKFNSINNKVFNSLIISAKTNDLKTWEMTRKNVIDKIKNKVKSNQFQLWLSNLKEIIINGKDPLDLVADRIAMIMATYAYPDHPKVITKYHIFYNKLNNLMVGVSAKLYYLDTGKLLGKISDLVPKYLESIPKDTFNNFKPLTFNKEKNTFIVYSFGPNRKDDKGNIIFDIDKYSKDGEDKGDILLSIIED